MEKLPPFERPDILTYGPAPKEQREKVKKVISKRFGAEQYEQLTEGGKFLRAKEYQLEPHQIQAIGKANEITNRLLVDAGLKPFDVPKQNIHLMPKGAFKEVSPDESLGAVTDIYRQAIWANKEEHEASELYLAATILHEIIHLKGHQALQVKEYGKDDDDLDVAVYRSGLRVNSTFAKDKRVKIGRGYNAVLGLNEAVVSEIQKRHFKSLAVSESVLGDELRRLDSKEAEELKGKIIERSESEKNIQLDAEEFIWVSEDGKRHIAIPYHEQRQVLYALVTAIFEDNQGRFDSKDRVMEKFFKSYFKGNLLEIGKLIDKSFGRGSFREVGGMGKDEENAGFVLDLLLRKRRLIKNKKHE